VGVPGVFIQPLLLQDRLAVSVGMATDVPPSNMDTGMGMGRREGMETWCELLP